MNKGTNKGDRTMKTNRMNVGDILWNGTIITSQTFADTYNSLSDDIEAKQSIGMSVEALLNGRHNLFNSYCIAFYA